MKKSADAASEIFRDESLRIKDFLKKNSRGMNIREIAEALQINRNSVAKYLDVLTSREEVDFKVFGKSKVYFLPQHVPASSLGRFSSNLIVILNRDQQIVQINDAFLNYLDMPRESVIGSAAREINCDLLEDPDVAVWSREALAGKEVAGEISLPEQGSLQHYRVVITPTQFPDNTPGIILFFENITEKKQIRAALAESEQNFRTLIEGSGDGCLILDETGTVIAWNSAVETISGIPATRAIGSSILDIIGELTVPEYRSKKQAERIKQGVLSIFQGKASPFRQYPDDMPILRKDGQRRYIQPVAFPVRLGRRMHYGVIIRDVTERRHMEEALVREKAFQNAVMDNAMGIFFVADEREQFIRWNRNLETITGYDTYDLLRIRATDILVPEDRDTIRNTYGTILHEKMPGVIETRILTKDGRTIPFLINGVTTLIGEKKFRVSLGVDISKRKTAEQTLQALFRSMVGTTGLDSLKKITENISSLLGADCVMVGELCPDKMSVNVLAMLLDGKDVEDFSYSLAGTPCEDVAAKGFCIYPDHARDLFPRAKDLADLNIRGYAGTPLRNATGETIGILCILSRTPLKTDLVTPGIVDIFAVKASAEIERKRAEDLLSASEEKFRRIVETANEGIWAMDRDFNTTFVNRKITELLGYSQDEMIGKYVGVFMEPAELADNVARLQNRREGKKETYERHLIKKDGSSCCMLVSATPLADADGNFDGSFAMMIDITQHRLAEQTLRESGDQFRNLVENVPGLAIQGYYMDGTTFFWNHASETLYGYTAEEAIGKNLLDLIIPPEMQEDVKGAIAWMAESGQPIPSSDLSLMKSDGSRVDVYSGHAIIRLPGKPVQLFCMDIDLTERKRAERAIRESEDRFDQVAKNADEWIWEVDENGLYRYSSAAIERILGYSPDEIVGKMHYHELFDPAVRDALLDLTRVAFGRHEPFRKFVNANRHRDGRTVVLETSGTPVFDKEGRFTGYRGCDTDITDRRNLELARQEALRQIEKNIGQFAVLGDNIRNPLTVILAHACHMTPESGEKISVQVREIDRIISEIDKGWIESQQVRSFLRKYYEIT